MMIPQRIRENQVTVVRFMREHIDAFGSSREINERLAYGIENPMMLDFIGEIVNEMYKRAVEVIWSSNTPTVGNALLHSNCYLNTIEVAVPILSRLLEESKSVAALQEFRQRLFAALCATDCAAGIYTEAQSWEVPKNADALLVKMGREIAGTKRV